jgi:hypothetical protein
MEAKSKMGENQNLHQSITDSELQQEILRGRKFTLEEAIARLAGPGAM